MALRRDSSGGAMTRNSSSRASMCWRSTRSAIAVPSSSPAPGVSSSPTDVLPHPVRRVWIYSTLEYIVSMSAQAGGELAPEEPVFFNPLDPEAHADPYPQYRRLREHAPMLRGPLGYWVLSRYADIAAVLRDPRFGVGIDEASLMLAMTQDGPGVATMVELSRWMLFRDPPDHTRLRGLVSKAFTPRALEAGGPRGGES